MGNEANAPVTITAEQWGRIFAHAWLDAEFAALLARDPTTAARHALGLDETTRVAVFPLPPRPEDLTDEQLEAIQAGREDYHVRLSY